MTLRQTVYLLLLCFAPLLCSHALALPPHQPFVLVLDAGHGGKDPGAVGRKAREKDIALSVTLLAGKYISEIYPDVKVLYTRKRDVFVGLNERADFANKSHADLFISIHTNSVDNPSPKGLEVYAFGVSRSAENLAVVKRENSVIYLEDNYREKYEGFDPNSAESYIVFEFMQNKFVEQSLEFASLACNELKTCTGWGDRGVKQAALLVLRKAAMPRVLIELDFISNPAAEKWMTSDEGRRKYARAICNAFSKYKLAYDRKNDLRPETKAPLAAAKPQSAVRPPSAPAEERTAARTATKNDRQAGRRIYKVQLFALPRPLPDNSPHLKGYKADYYIENNMYKYTFGESESLEEISRIRKTLLPDFRDAFIVAFEDGKRTIIQ